MNKEKSKKTTEENTPRTPNETQNFELCEGICLQIKESELTDWENETSSAKNLNAEQHRTLKSTLEKIASNRSLTRKEIAQIIEEVRKPQRKTPKYRQSGHLIDQKLKYTPKQNQPTLFDSLMPQTKREIEESHIEVKAEGIKLTQPENKLVHALNRILYEKSQHTDSKSENFYSGNYPSELVPYGLPDYKAKPAVIKFRPGELYKAYIGNDNYSGHDIDFINETIRQLESKRVLIKYDRVKKVRDKTGFKTLTDRIEDFQSLIKIISFIPDLTEEERLRLEKGDTTIRESKGEIIIALNPIFTDQIDTKFIEFPVDTNRRLVIAAGGHNRVTASMHTLMEWMHREISAKRYTAEVNEENLPYMLGLENYIKQGRKKKLRERIAKDIEAIVNMGIIFQVEKIQNSTGGIKWIFHLNKDYE